MLMGGETGIGKSFLAYDLAHALATGEKAWATFTVPAPRPVLIVENELGLWGVQKRLYNRYKESEAPSNVYIASRAPGLKLDTLSGFHQIRGLVEQASPGLLIVDPIARQMLGSDSDNSHVGMVIDSLDRLLAEFSTLSICLVHHFCKPREEDVGAALYRFRGGRWMDAADTIAIVRAPQPGKLIWEVSIDKLRHDAAIGTINLRADPRGAVIAESGFGSAGPEVIGDRLGQPTTERLLQSAL